MARSLTPVSLGPREGAKRAGFLQKAQFGYCLNSDLLSLGLRVPSRTGCHFYSFLYCFFCLKSRVLRCIRMALIAPLVLASLKNFPFLFYI